jgi:glutamine amidotransferase
MAQPRIAIIDYGAGNLRSVAKAFDKIGYPAEVTAEPDAVLAADAVVLPGVGAAGDTMTSLTAEGLVDAIHDVIVHGRPFFGVCIGLQVLFESSEEGGAECLGILRGQVRRLPATVKVPHIGWNQVDLLSRHPLFEGIENGSNFYFVHSYYGDPANADMVVGQTDYGIAFPSVIARGNLVATQFHPEKSGELGLKIYDNFVKLLVGASA